MGKDLTVKEVAEMLGVLPTTVYKYIRIGKLESYKLCGRAYITPEAIQKFIMKENTRGN